MANEIEVKPSADFQMLTLDSFVGRGIMTHSDGRVSIAFKTDGPSIDVTMTPEQAAYLLEVLNGELSK